MVVALLALVVACSGTAVAASVLITSSKQIRTGVITASNVHSRTLTGKQIQRGSLGPDLLSARAIKSLSAAAGATAHEWFRKAGPEDQPAGNPQRVVTASGLPAGTYAIFAKTILTDLDPVNSFPLSYPAKTADGHCRLSAGADLDDGRVLIGTSFGNGPGTMSMQVTHTFNGSGDITMDCDSASTWRASDSSIKLADVTRASVSR
jgi:hypothetical protein